mmetsp:Transcript_9189/g.27657  ORF Transcript_9189/g.27657 Transcript_9189/m.27657 type:complete len:1024 (-) Transcript_9189:207-3278(-)|eukprot:CAMPEP_0198733076 /NCGR_PEP_ID=MMETSP1475-20131203/42422_1 /TAXON_ID= ORGANISM="Unidentified sp., Strain CCMP1999" /NCGR_SAMPLE_ID=MMETSP1475 /ASSEMBLY_ACC=CAM_ASM_001111 /LENGTH=1023 /DNA_ID=CAMNT_0044496309 /DNA_START=626 /DNA_END=3697 /DNA_ORIENTATION=+
MQDTEIQVSADDDTRETPANSMSRRRSKRDRKRRHTETEVPTGSKKSTSSRGSAKKGSKSSTKAFRDVSSPANTDPALTEKRRKLLERLNQISAEKEKIRRLQKDREYARSLREQASSAGAHASPGAGAVKANGDAPIEALDDSSVPAAATEQKPVVPEIEFSLDLQKSTAAPGSPIPNTPDVAMSPGTRAKRQRTPSVLLKTQPGETQIVATPGSRSKQYTFCHRLVKDFTKNRDAVSFAQPVTELWRSEAIPNYHAVIKHPMDLRTVMRKMESGAYVDTQGDFDPELWAADMRLIFSNAMTYNRVGDAIYEAAKNLLQRFEQKIQDMPQKGELNSPKRSSKKKKTKSLDKKHHSKHHKKREAAEPLSPDKLKRSFSGGEQEEEDEAEDETEKTIADVERKLLDVRRQESILKAMQNPAASPTTPKYAIQAAALYHMPMTYEEKRRLTENIGKLSGEKLGKLIEIVAKRVGKAEMNKDEEIELDIDAMDNKTLRQMEAFVNSVVGRRRTARKDLTLDQASAEVARLEKLLARKKQEEKNANREGGLVLDLQSSSSDSNSGSGSDSNSSSSSDSESSEGEAGDILEKRKRRELAFQQMSQASPRMLASPFAAVNRGGQSSPSTSQVRSTTPRLSSKTIAPMPSSSSSPQSPEASSPETTNEAKNRDFKLSSSQATQQSKSVAKSSEQTTALDARPPEVDTVVPVGSKGDMPEKESTHAEPVEPTSVKPSNRDEVGPETDKEKPTVNNSIKDNIQSEPPAEADEKPATEERRDEQSGEGGNMMELDSDGSGEVVASGPDPNAETQPDAGENEDVSRGETGASKMIAGSEEKAAAERSDRTDVVPEKSNSAQIGDPSSHEVSASAGTPHDEEVASRPKSGSQDREEEKKVSGLPREAKDSHSADGNDQAAGAKVDADAAAPARDKVRTSVEVEGSESSHPTKGAKDTRGGGDGSRSKPSSEAEGAPTVEGTDVPEKTATLPKKSNTETPMDVSDDAAASEGSQEKRHEDQRNAAEGMLRLLDTGK